MIKKICSMLFDNFGLKILALASSVIIWLVVVNVNDPEVPRQFSCAVTIENEEALENMGKTYEIVDGSTAVFTVRAKRSVMKNLSNSDFKAVANMENVEDMTYVPIEVTALRYSGQLEITKRTQNVEIVVEDLQSSQFIITAGQEGTPAEGCVVGNLSVSPNVLKVSGPASIVSTISKVVATINVNGMSTDISDSVIPTLYDEAGEVVDTTKLSMNLTTVTVDAQILNEKEVSLNFQTTGTPADGYAFMGLEYTPESITVMGDTAVLNALNEISIPEEVLDISGATGDIEKTVDITAYLPEGVSLVDTAKKDISVVVRIETAVTREYAMPTANITISNIPSGYEAAFEGDTVTVTVSGFASDLDALSADSLTGSVDVSGLKEGSHYVTLSLNLDESLYSEAGTQTVSVTLTKETAGTGNSSNAADDDDASSGTSSGTGSGTSGGTSGGTTGNSSTSGGTSSGTNGSTSGGTSSGTNGSTSGGTSGGTTAENSGTSGSTTGNSGAASGTSGSSTDSEE